MSNPESGNFRGTKLPELTAPRGRGYHGNMAEQSTAERLDFGNFDHSIKIADKPKFQVFEGDAGRADKEAWGRLARTELGESIRMYSMLRPELGWDSKDQAGIMFMLGQPPLDSDAHFVKKIIARKAGSSASVYSELANFESDFLEAHGKGNKILPQDEETLRGYLVNHSAWKDLDRRGLLKNRLSQLGAKELVEYSMYWTGSLVNNEFYNAHKADVRSILTTLGEVVREKKILISDEANISGGGGAGGGGGDTGGGAGGGGEEESWRGKMLEATLSLLDVNVDQLTALDSINSTLNEILSGIKDINKNIADSIDDIGKTSEYIEKLAKEDVRQKEFVRQRAEMQAVLMKRRLEHRKQVEEHELKELAKRSEISDIELERAKKQQKHFDEREKDEEKLYDKKPWEKKDKELYEGDVHEVLRERKWRIAYLCARSEDGRGKNNRDKIKQYLMQSENKENINESTMGAMDVFMDRMEANEIYEELEEKGGVEREMGIYMQELKRWAKDIIGNSQYSKGALEIPTSLYDDLQKIIGCKVKLYEYGSVTDDRAKEMFREDLKQSVARLGEMDFESAFTKVNANGETVGVVYRPQSEYAGEDTPKDLYETCRLIEMLYPKEHYKTGEEHELFNEYGEFQLHNFLYYTYERMWEYSDRNSQSQVNLLGDIGLRTRYTELTFGQLMEIPKYTQIRKFKMSGKVQEKTDDGKKEAKFEAGALDTGWGDYEDHPQFNLAVRDIIKRFVWQLQVRHNGGVYFINPNTRAELGESVKVMYELAGKGDEYRNGYLLMTMQRPSSKAEEVEDYFKHDKQGSLGKAERDANLVLRHMKELSEHYVKKNEKGEIVGVRSVEENYALKALGYDGASSFMLKVAESSLMFSEKRTEIQKAYRDYLASIMDQMRRDYKDKAGSEKHAELDRLIDKKKTELYGPDIDKEAISFDTSIAINELVMAIETTILGKSIVRDNEYDHWKATGKVISRKEVNDETRRLIRRGMKEEFFDKILKMEIVSPDSGLRTEIGNITVKTCDGRVVTDAEWEKIGGGAAKEKVTIREIFNDFDGFGKVDGGKLMDDELEYAKTALELKHGIRAARDAGNAADEAALKVRLEAHKRDYERIYERNERLGLALLTKVAKVKRSELNYFNSAEPSRTALTISRDSIVASTSKVYGLSDIERKVVGEGIHYDQILNGNALINNTSSPRINALSWFVRTKEMWRASRGVKPNSGLYDEVKAIMPGTWWDVMSVNVVHKGIKTNYTKLFQGNADTVEEMVDREDRVQDGSRRLYDTSREEFGYKFSRYIMDGAKFIENLKKDESLELHKLVTRDKYGTLRFDTEKARKEMAEHWHPMWDAINKTGINQEATIRVDGQTIKNKQYMFGNKTLAAVEALRYYHASVAAENVANSGIHREMAEELESKYAMGVLAAYYATSIKEHSEIFGGVNDYWDPELAKQMWWFLGKYFMKEGENKYGEKVEVSYMPMGMMDDVLAVEKISQKGQILKLFFIELIASLFDGLFNKGLKELMDELVQVEKIYRR